MTSETLSLPAPSEAAAPPTAGDRAGVDSDANRFLVSQCSDCRLLMWGRRGLCPECLVAVGPPMILCLLCDLLIPLAAWGRHALDPVHRFVVDRVQRAALELIVEGRDEA